MGRVALDRPRGRRLLPVDDRPYARDELLEGQDRLLHQSLLLGRIFGLGQLAPVRVEPVDRGHDRVAVRSRPRLGIVDGEGPAGRVEVRQLPAAEYGARRREDQVPDMGDRLALADAEIDLARARVDPHGLRGRRVLRGEVLRARRAGRSCSLGWRLRGPPSPGSPCRPWRRSRRRPWRRPGPRPGSVRPGPSCAARPRSA